MKNEIYQYVSLVLIFAVSSTHPNQNSLKHVEEFAQSLQYVVARVVHNPQLIAAAKEGKLEEIENLLRYGADVNAQDCNGWTALHYACWKGDKTVVGALLEAGADVDAKSKYNYTPLHFAANQGHGMVVKALIEAGANVNAQNKNKDTPLNLAANKNHDDVVHILYRAVRNS